MPARLLVSLLMRISCTPAILVSDRMAEMMEKANYQQTEKKLQSDLELLKTHLQAKQAHSQRQASGGLVVLA